MKKVVDKPSLKWYNGNVERQKRIIGATVQGITAQSTLHIWSVKEFDKSLTMPP